MLFICIFFLNFALKFNGKNEMERAKGKGYEESMKNIYLHDIYKSNDKGWGCDIHGAKMAGFH